VSWIQRSLSLPAEIGNELQPRTVQSGLIVSAEGTVIVLQPGAIGMQAFDLDSGRRVWQRAIPDLYQIAGAADGLIFALTPRGLLAVHASTGEVAWQKSLGLTPIAWSVSDTGGVSIGELVPVESGTEQLVIHNLAATDGSELAKTLIVLPADSREVISPVVSSNGRFFLFGYDRDHAAARLLELQATSDGSR
jgi:outer membrane protein assembly factor BamB